MPDADPVVFRSAGRCPTCGNEAEFVAREPWLRDALRCSACGSIPRERALMSVIETFLPGWRERVIHESSPAGRGASERLRRECPRYVASQYFPGRRPGSSVEGMRCEDLENLSFPDGSIDLHVTQDVFEHVFHPARAFREIARTLAPGGMHVFTVPIVRRHEPSRLRARLEEGRVVHLEPEEYHGNPVGDGRSLVTVDWGFDICRHVFDASGLYTHIVTIDDPGRGIRAEYIEVLVTVKPARAPEGGPIP